MAGSEMVASHHDRYLGLKSALTHVERRGLGDWQRHPWFHGNLLSQDWRFLKVEGLYVSPPPCYAERQRTPIAQRDQRPRRSTRPIQQTEPASYPGCCHLDSTGTFNFHPLQTRSFGNCMPRSNSYQGSWLDQEQHAECLRERSQIPSYRVYKGNFFFLHSPPSLSSSVPALAPASSSPFLTSNQIY